MNRSSLLPVLLALGIAVTVGWNGRAAQTGKKVYISVDMEGISGISGDDQINVGGAEYGRGRKLMAEDANAAVRGALAGGATEVVVNDSHGGQRNLMAEDLHPAARLISHSFKRLGMMEGLDDTFDAVVFVGYHAKASDPRGLFAHTGSGVVRDLTINGVSVGEGGMNALLAAWYGVPVVAVTGDDVAVAQVREVARDAVVVAVKRAINLHAVELQPLDAARKAIEEGVRQGVGRAKKLSPRQPGRIDVRLQFRDVSIPEIADVLPGFDRPAPDTLVFTTDTMPKAYRLIRLLYRYVVTS